MSETVTPYSRNNSSKKEEVRDMFDNIAHSYDFLNHFLSAGTDIAWRKKAVRKLKADQPKKILDMATGTGDFAIEALSLKPESVIGVDLSPGMLEIGKKKMKEKGVDNVIQMEVGDSEELRFEDNTFDAVTVGFGVRNFENLEKGLSEIRRVLKPGGKLVVLECSTPQRFPIRQFYFLYFKRILPFFGKLVSKDSRAYSYLPESVIAFPSGKKFTDILHSVGFKQTTVQPLMMGVSSIYTGVK